MDKIFIVILNFNGWKNTINCLRSLEKINSNNINIETIVVDNASVDSSVEKIKNEFPELTLIENRENLGFTGGNNEGIRLALKSGADFIMLLNNDTIVDPMLVKNLLKPFEHDRVGGVVPKIYFEKGYEFHKERYKDPDKGKVIWYAGGRMDWDNLIGENIGVDEVDHGQFDIRMETELATGCCIMLRTSLISKIGLFDDRYFLYYEDADLSQRIRRRGFKIIYEPESIVWHKNAESSGGSGSSLQDYYITRNRLLFGMKYAPMKTKLALIRESLSLIRSGRKWQKAGVRDYYLKRFGHGSFKI